MGGKDSGETKAMGNTKLEGAGKNGQTFPARGHPVGRKSQLNQNKQPKEGGKSLLRRAGPMGPLLTTGTYGMSVTEKGGGGQVHCALAQPPPPLRVGGGGQKRKKEESPYVLLGPIRVKRK